jgi:hypothetical protein
MRFAVAVAILVAIGTMASAQKTKDGLPQSHYASPKIHRSSSAGPIAAPRANANAAELTKIEQEGARAQTQSAKRAPAPPRLSSLAQDKNKPMRFTKSRPSGNSGNTNTRSIPRRVGKVH